MSVTLCHRAAQTGGRGNNSLDIPSSKLKYSGKKTTKNLKK